MSRSEDERTPLVYEDRVGSSSSGIVEEDGGRRRRRNICIALTTACLGVGLVLAIALPITMSQGKEESPNPVSLLANSALRLTFELSDDSVTTQESNWLTADQRTNEMHPSVASSSSSSFSSSDSSSSSSSSSDSPTTVSSSSVSSEYSSSNKSPSPTLSSVSSTASPPDLFASCNSVPQERRSSINLERLNGKLLFELYRVQTRNSPGYTSELSCSVMELNFGSSSTNATESKDGTMKLKWMESGFISRYPRAIDVHLERNQESSYDWTETFGNQSNAKGQLSLLVQLDGYLLTYECFPNVSYYPNPAYTIHLYSMVPWPGNTYVATSLMTLANIWGLNPAEERITPISHRFCSLLQENAHR